MSITTTVIANTSTLAEQPPAPSPHVHWADNTVDNEGMGKKKSKKCCIFKKRKPFGESSDEDENCLH